MTRNKKREDIIG